MFDVNHETRIEQSAATPDAATKEPPVRIELCGKLVWLRPSNVLRIEFRPAHIGFPDRVVIALSDNKDLVFSEATVAVADAIAALLWPTQKLD